MKCYISYNGRDSVESVQVQSRHSVNVATTADWVKTNQNRTRDVAFIKMYAEFAKTSYDLKASSRNLIEYQVSTFGGQNGAPILRKDGGQIVSIGTHCYGDSEHCNSGTSIDNKYGNNYGSYIGLFDDPLTFGSQVNMVEVPPQ
ncbi:hypothetical protein CEP54_015866 [Fusarium duplospermum]|uniref:Serine protease n=1 Tax=Fusarium duplospermum TaxID=1325734 RepID=A0A428NKR7_9HYPO|nr:hypothetical protein CEP54_015866 [Fusarium duplospermum]